MPDISVASLMGYQKGLTWVTVTADVNPAVDRMAYMVQTGGTLKQVTLPANVPAGFYTQVAAQGGQVRIVLNGNALTGMALGDNIVMEAGASITLVGRSNGVIEVVGSLMGTAIGAGAATRPVNALALSIYNKIIGWWERDETSGTVMTDQHTNALHGTYSGLTLNQAPLASGLTKSVTFPAGNNYAEVPDNPLLRPMFNMACFVWVKRNGAQGNYPKLMWKPGGTKVNGQATFLLTQDNVSLGGKAQFRITTSGGNIDANSATVLADATPYMILGNRLNDEISIWINGAKEGTNTGAGNAGAVTNAPEALRFGYHGAAGDPWVGSQDQAALFNSYLTAAEVAYLYNGGAGISYAALKSAAGL